MELLYPNQFKELNRNATLENYLTYLEQQKMDLEGNLKFIEQLNVNSVDVEEIQREIKQLNVIIQIMRKNMGYLIVPTIKSFSSEDLKIFFSEEHIKNIYNENFQKKEKLTDQYQKLDKKRSELLKIISKKNTWYNVPDIGDFFSSKSPLIFLKKCIFDEQYEVDAIVAFFAQSLENVCKSNKVNISRDEIDKCSSEFQNIINQYRKVSSYFLTSQDEFTMNLLSQNGNASIYSILKSWICENLIDLVCQNMANYEKMNSPFFELLPQDKSQKLFSESFAGETYRELELEYQDFQDKGTTKEELECQKINKILEGISAKLCEIDKFLSNFEGISVHFDTSSNHEILKEKLIQLLSGNIPTETLDTICLNINEELQKQESVKKELNEALLHAEVNINTLKAKIKEAYDALSDTVYFSRLKSLKDLRIFNLLGFAASNKIVESYVLSEKKRQQQILFMINLQNKLDKLRQEMENYVKESTFLHRQTNKFKKHLNTMREEYFKISEQGLEEMKRKGYLKIDGIDASKSKSANVNFKIKKFSDIPSLASQQEFINFKNSSFQESVLVEVFPEGIHAENLEIMQNLQRGAVKAMFSFSVNDQGFYDFVLTESQQKALIDLQSMIVVLVQKEFETREAWISDVDSISFYENYVNSRTQQLEDIFQIKITDEQDIENFIENCKREIRKFWLFMISHEKDCLSNGITIPAIDDVMPENDMPIESINESLLTPQSFINLDILDVTTYEEALFYKQMLLEMKAYNLSTNQVLELYQRTRLKESQ